MSLELQIRVPLDRFELRVEGHFTERVTGVFGPSGAGKSTLLRVLVGLHPARGRVALGGRVWLDSDAGLRLAPEDRGVGYVPQDGLLFPHLNVRKNILFGAARAQHRGLDPEQILGRASAIMGLEALLGRRVGTLSGGERQRVALARALCSGPELLVLDEPLASLDQELRARILPMLQRVRQDFDCPMLIVSHDPDELRTLCDQVLVLERGEVLRVGPPDQVL